MKFKNFTQAYFLIKNNPTYANSLAMRGQAAIFGVVTSSLFFAGTYTSRIPADDKV